jgi:hypothetical protein
VQRRANGCSSPERDGAATPGAALLLFPDTRNCRGAGFCFSSKEQRRSLRIAGHRGVIVLFARAIL